MAALGISPTVRRVAATDSGSVELTPSASVPSNSEVWIDVLECEGTDVSPVVDRTGRGISDRDVTHVLDRLECDPDYYYDFEIGLGTEADSPTFDAFTLEVPVPDPEPQNFDTVTHDTMIWNAKPDAVRITYDEYRLRKYQPMLKMSQGLRRQFDGVYAFLAESDNEDTFVCCYWLGLPRAETAWADYISQLGSHKPICVFVDEGSEEIQKIVYSGYQPLTGEVKGDDLELQASWVDEPTHASFAVIDPWNHIMHTPGSGGSLDEVQSLPEERETWISNGWYDAPDEAVIENPWTMQNDREGWWSDSSWSFSSQMVTIARRLGSAGGKEADELRAGSAAGSSRRSTSAFGRSAVTTAIHTEVTP